MGHETNLSDDAARDALHVLPLGMFPLETQALRRVRMIKNVNLESVIELYQSAGTGSGYVSVDGLDRVFPGIPAKDYATLFNLSRLPTYDVYSLRVLLKKNGIPVEDEAMLQLSPAKRKELQAQMNRFTRPLVLNVFGSEGEVDTGHDLIGLIAHPDVKQARTNLVKLAQKLGIGLEEVPRFLTDYGDAFLSISYYQQCLDRIQPAFQDFQSFIKELRANRQAQSNPQMMRTCDQVEGTLDKWRSAVVMRFRAFERGCDAIWVDIDPAQFRRFHEIIADSHVAMGAALCALSVKLDAWTRAFPDRDRGGFLKRADFIVNELRHGLSIKLH